MKFYIFQLKDGKMLVFENNEIKIEETGYPLPDCRLQIGSKVLNSKVDIMKAILGYEIEDFSAFVEFAQDLEPIPYNEFKLKVYRDEIGGNCPEKLHEIGVDVIDLGFTYEEALFRHILPLKFLNMNKELPDLSEYKDLLYKNWNYSLTDPSKRSSRFKGNILMYSGIRDFNEKYIEFIKLLLSSCNSVDYFHHLTTITTKSGITCLLLSDCISRDEDFQYFYSKIAGVDLFDGFIDVEVVENDVELCFCCEDDSQKAFYRNKKPFRGSFKRYEI